jgi:hypothetical protein
MFQLLHIIQCRKSFLTKFSPDFDACAPDSQQSIVRPTTDRRFLAHVCKWLCKDRQTLGLVRTLINHEKLAEWEQRYFSHGDYGDDTTSIMCETLAAAFFPHQQRGGGLPWWQTWCHWTVAIPAIRWLQQHRDAVMNFLYNAVAVNPPPVVAGQRPNLTADMQVDEHRALVVILLCTRRSIHSIR